MSSIYKNAVDAVRSKADRHGCILRPLLTEKSTRLSDELNVYSFEVAPNANKLSVAKAVEAMFDVKVDKVNIINIKGSKIVFAGKRGVTASFKKAMVKVAQGYKIDLLGKEG